MFRTVLLVLLLVVVAVSYTEAGRRGGGKCKYGKGSGSDRGDCDPTTRKRTMTLVLKKGNATTCAATKVVSRPCRNKQRGGASCKYGRGEGFIRGECTAEGTREMTFVLRRGDANTCAATKTVTKQCRHRNVRNADGCKYQKGPWSDCDAMANTITRTLTLKKGDATKCEASKNVTRKCKKACKYTKTPWTQCKKSTNQMSRTMTLKKGDPTKCEATKTATRKCKKACGYRKGTWSACDETKKRSRTDTLEAGNDATQCEATRTVQRLCKQKKKKQGCTFGPWGKFSACQNGVRTKVRPVVSGGEKCQRKAAKTKPC